MSQLILQPFHRFTYVTAHSSTLPLLHLHHSSFSKSSFASPTSQALLLHHLASRPYHILKFCCRLLITGTQACYVKRLHNKKESALSGHVLNRIQIQVTASSLTQVSCILVVHVRQATSTNIWTSNVYESWFEQQSIRIKIKCRLLHSRHLTSGKWKYKYLSFNWK